MDLPDVNAYAAAFQHPEVCLSDPILKRCEIRKNPLGQPRVRSGGFALTYNLFSGDKENWAVRCFHRESSDRDARYSAISAVLNNPVIKNSNYFVPFEYQPQGITMPNGQKFPIVKMKWARGETLGNFLEDRHGDRSALEKLRGALSRLSGFLRKNGIAHGDIQPGNIMVSDDGKTVQLIDYDGMFVKRIERLQATEIGLPNFQHPERRTKSPWNANLDNFSFVVLDSALQILAQEPSYWEKTQSGDDKVLFGAQDYATPDVSTIFNELKRDGRYSALVTKLQSVCKVPIEQVPSLEQIANWIPTAGGFRAHTGSVETSAYISAYPVVDALKVGDIAAQSGNVVEVVGCVKKMVERQTVSNNPKPYYFMDFVWWRPGVESFRFIIWSEQLEKLKAKGVNSLSDYFEGKYVSITGLVGKWVSAKYGTAYQISSDGAAVRLITCDEARFRLGKLQRKVVVPHITVAAPIVARLPSPSSNPGAKTTNGSILDRIRNL